MVGVGLVCEHVCFRRRGLQLVILPEAWLLMPNTAKRFTTLTIKHNAKLGSAGLNQTQNPSSSSVSHDFPPSVFLPHLEPSPANIAVNFIC